MITRILHYMSISVNTNKYNCMCLLFTHPFFSTSCVSHFLILERNTFRFAVEYSDLGKSQNILTVWQL
jgi:hypothetical protein